PGRPGDPLRLHAPARLPLRHRGRGLPERPRPELHHRAEPRRPAAHAAGGRDRCGQGEAEVAARLRRLSPVRPPRRRWDHREGQRSRVVTKKPTVVHPSLKKNALGLTIRDYEGSMSTLCAGCGHDSVTAAIVRAFWELETPPH